MPLLPGILVVLHCRILANSKYTEEIYELYYNLFIQFGSSLEYGKTIVILNITNRALFDLKHSVSDIGSCLRLQVVPNQLDPVDRSIPCLRTIPFSTYYLQLSSHIVIWAYIFCI
jgi:hypothetical protein